MTLLIPQFSMRNSMKKIFIFVFTLFIGLFAFSGWCGNILEDAQYETIKKLNGEFFEEYKKLSAIQTRLLKLSSYDTTFRYADTWLDSATEHVTFVLNLWGYEYGFIKWLPAIRAVYTHTKSGTNRICTTNGAAWATS